MAAILVFFNVLFFGLDAYFLHYHFFEYKPPTTYYANTGSGGNVGDFSSVVINGYILIHFIVTFLGGIYFFGRGRFNENK